MVKMTEKQKLIIKTYVESGCSSTQTRVKLGYNTSGFVDRTVKDPRFQQYLNKIKLDLNGPGEIMAEYSLNWIIGEKRQMYENIVSPDEIEYYIIKAVGEQFEKYAIADTKEDKEVAVSEIAKAVKKELANFEKVIKLKNQILISIEAFHQKFGDMVETGKNELLNKSTPELIETSKKIIEDLERTNKARDKDNGFDK